MRAFTLIELVFVIVLIGILSVVALPRFTGMRDNAKIASELSTAASVQTAIDACHGEWIINEGSFVCGKDIDPTDASQFDKTNGFPIVLGSDDNHPLNKILKNADNIKWIKDSAGHYRGPASNDGVKAKNPDIPGKPDSDDYWTYDPATGEFTLVDN
ncbi:type II secretion system protein [Hydrogenimonas sp.]|jgi:prepilin-type N-terminal cleavage/methylation domain-containing protein|uniref:type II secretion system protein n=1 Tax=Hydrogenimonas sp. TaxID=2231112 RepID=UPI0026229A60|nr:type II secretion system protein [Hydrogenimonas sp.]